MQNMLNGYNSMQYLARSTCEEAHKPSRRTSVVVMQSLMNSRSFDTVASCVLALVRFRACAWAAAISACAGRPMFHSTAAKSPPAAER